MTGALGPDLSRVSVPDLIAHLAAESVTVATAESVTGGRLIAALTSVAGSSVVVRGSVVAYSSDVKTAMLGVDPTVLADQGPVCVDVAEQMAEAVRDRLGATFGVSTTGEAGPASASGRPVGTVFIAVAGPRGTTTLRLDVVGTREEIQQGAVAGALRMLAEAQASGGSGIGLSPEAGIGNKGD